MVSVVESRDHATHLLLGLGAANAEGSSQNRCSDEMLHKLLPLATRRCAVVLSSRLKRRCPCVQISDGTGTLANSKGHRVKYRQYPEPFVNSADAERMSVEGHERRFCLCPLHVCFPSD